MRTLPQSLSDVMQNMNAMNLQLAGHQIWFHSIVGDEQVVAIFDYIEAMVRADRFLPPPLALAAQVFDVFDWPRPTATAPSAEPVHREALTAPLPAD